MCNVTTTTSGNESHRALICQWNYEWERIWVISQCGGSIDRAPPGLKTNRDHLIRDNLKYGCPVFLWVSINLGHYCFKTLKQQRERKKGSATRRWTWGIRIKPSALCHWAMTHVLRQPPLSLLFLCSKWLLFEIRSGDCCVCHELERIWAI